MLKRLVLSLLALPMLALWGDVKLPALFTDHGVLARSAKTPIFGKADPGEVVTVKLADLQGKATADAGGKWRVDGGNAHRHMHRRRRGVSLEQ